MENLKDNEDQISGKEDDISASKADQNASEKPADDGFKTANRKHKLEWRQPPDEQMFDDTDLSTGSE